MTNITGARMTSNIAAERRMVDMAKDIALLDPNEGPFLTFLKVLRKDSRVVFNPKFEWLEDDLLETWSSVNGAVSASATSITVADGSIFREGDVLKLPATDENLLVTAVSDNSLTVVRGYGSTTAAAIADKAALLNLGPAMEENSSLRTVKSTKESTGYNFTQIFRTPIALSGTEAASMLHGGKDRAYQRRKASIEHKRDIARALYFGQRKEDLSGSGARRTMGGLVQMLGDNNKVSFDSSSNPLTYRNFDIKVAKEVFRHGSQNKLLIAGPNLAAAINSWADKKLVTDVSNDTYGLRVKNLITTYGDLKVIYDPLLEGAVYEGYGFVLDTENVRYAYLDGRDTKLNVGIQSPDLDGIVDEFLTECSLEVRLPQTHMVITGAYVPEE
ncbi:MAG: DUF5309 family protein [Firmicutes bacterium]|nr:DUF5309 family protein [Bacillota bacterium]